MLHERLLALTFFSLTLVMDAILEPDGSIDNRSFAASSRQYVLSTDQLLHRFKSILLWWYDMCDAAKITVSGQNLSLNKRSHLFCVSSKLFDLGAKLMNHGSILDHSLIQVTQLWVECYMGGRVRRDRHLFDLELAHMADLGLHIFDHDARRRLILAYLLQITAHFRFHFILQLLLA